MVDDVEAQQEFDDFFEEVFTELEDKVGLSDINDLNTKNVLILIYLLGVFFLN